jgi:cysteinyl-tRNA synthetase
MTATLGIASTWSPPPFALRELILVLRLYNTLTRKTEPFEPADGKTVRMYTCGPTVYDYAHIGNFRTFLFEDLLRRYLRYKGYGILHVMNITDVDDKTIAGAKRTGKTLREYTDTYEQAFFEDLAALNIERPEICPRATEHIPEMLELIRRLESRGHTYVTDGSVYFRLSTFQRYGRLSGIEPAGMQAGVRGESDEYSKDDVRDFALWKAAKEGEPSWDSPWGPGRPGWHIECSAMSMKYLGETFDIHAGGVDLVFPHHENEVAQSEAATGKPFARFWVHGEHLLVNNEKMSKSLGNYFTLRDLLAKGYDPQAIRFLILQSAHYRHQLNFTLEALDHAGPALRRLHDFLDRLQELQPTAPDNQELSEAVRQTRRKFEEAMDDDLNAPAAIGHIFELVRLTNTCIDENAASKRNLQEVHDLLMDFDRVLGFLAHEKGLLDEEVQALIDERAAARKAKDFARADAIRDQLAKQGIILEDTPAGVRWRRT